LAISLRELASTLAVTFSGDGDVRVDHVAPLEEAGEGALSFLANRRYRRFLANTAASVVVLREEWLPDCPTAALLTDNPYLLYARAASLLYPQAPPVGAIHPSAVVADDVHVPDSVRIGAVAVVEAGVHLAEGVSIGPGCVVSAGCHMGTDSCLVANVTLGPGVRLGERVLIQPGAVIGAEGFGFANDQGAWVKVPQLGSVVIGDDVEVGANTCIDRGALRDTLIKDGVKLDNLIMIAHNVEIGEHTAIAACSGVSGSTRIGRYCTLAGASGLVGHIELGDHVHVTGMTMVTRSLPEAGVYSGNVPAEPNKRWLRTMVQLRRLDELGKRVKELEQRLDELS
jgi:UDP-3-O-[3-hydroxymyristoyl] glucosamine N-acyltransferase